MFSGLKEDIRCILEQDPAARSAPEVILTYAGLHAIWGYKAARFFHRRGRVFIARCISQWTRTVTGVEIHPGATIGRRLFIDHGTGVVIGETCEIGDDVTLYQGVTLGGTGKEKGKRHPTIGNNVLIASGAKVLGSISIGDNSKVGANAVVLKNVPPNSTVVGIPGRVVIQDGIKIKHNHQDMPDPIGETCRVLAARIDELEARLRTREAEEESEDDDSDL